MARSNSAFLEHLLVGGWRVMKFPQEKIKRCYLKEMAPKGDGVGDTKSATPSFVSMWPSNVELLSMVTEVNKRKHILEFPLFKRTENQTKIEA